MSDLRTSPDDSAPVSEYDLGSRELTETLNWSNGAGISYSIERSFSLDELDEHIEKLQSLRADLYSNIAERAEELANEAYYGGDGPEGCYR